MHAEELRPGTTLLFCRTDDEGSIIPNWDDIVESQLKGHFEIGLTVAERYLLTKILGSGSMGCVFLAKDLHLDESRFHISVDGTGCSRGFGAFAACPYMNFLVPASEETH